MHLNKEIYVWNCFYINFIKILPQLEIYMEYVHACTLHWICNTIFHLYHTISHIEFASTSFLCTVLLYYQNIFLYYHIKTYHVHNRSRIAVPCAKNFTRNSNTRDYPHTNNNGYRLQRTACFGDTFTRRIRNEFPIFPDA